MLLSMMQVTHCPSYDTQTIIDKPTEGAENLLKVSLALGAMYMFAFFIEIYGITGVSLVSFLYHQYSNTSVIS